MENNYEKHILTNLKDLKGKRVVVRVDWNMPINNGIITDFSRFDVTVPFLKELSFTGAKIIILTHFGQKGESLKIIADHITKTLSFISFLPTLDFEEIKQKISECKESDGVLLENVRMWKGEEENIPSLSKSFAELGDIFVNDAFSVSHREHCSVVSIAKNMLSYFGPTFTRELKNLSLAVNPDKPALVIIGGAKISTKIPLINHYLNQGVKVFVGGAMVHNIFKARGYSIGKSLYDSKYSLPESLINHPLLLTPVDVVLESRKTISWKEIGESDIVVDCGEQTVENIKQEMDPLVYMRKDI